jgi:hypothetical protein
MGGCLLAAVLLHVLLPLCRWDTLPSLHLPGWWWLLQQQTITHLCFLNFPMQSIPHQDVQRGGLPWLHTGQAPAPSMPSALLPACPDAMFPCKYASILTHPECTNVVVSTMVRLLGAHLLQTYMSPWYRRHQTPCTHLTCRASTPVQWSAGSKPYPDPESSAIMHPVCIQNLSSTLEFNVLCVPCVTKKTPSDRPGHASQQ